MLLTSKMEEGGHQPRNAALESIKSREMNSLLDFLEDIQTC